MKSLQSVKRPLVVAYSLVVLAMVVGFYELWLVDKRLDREVEIRQATTCRSYEQLEQVIEDIVNQSAQGNGDIPDQFSEELRDYILVSRERSREFRDFVVETLDELECPEVQYADLEGMLLRLEKQAG